jgi:hypothetical protein
MTKPKTVDDVDAEIAELISKKIAAEDADSGWVVAYAAMRLLPAVKDVADHLNTMRWVLGEDVEGSSTGHASPQIAAQLKRIASLLQQLAPKER